MWTCVRVCIFRPFYKYNSSKSARHFNVFVLFLQFWWEPKHFDTINPTHRQITSEFSFRSNRIMSNNIWMPRKIMRIVCFFSLRLLNVGFFIRFCIWIGSSFSPVRERVHSIGGEWNHDFHFNSQGKKCITKLHWVRDEIEKCSEQATNAKPIQWPVPCIINHIVAQILCTKFQFIIIQVTIISTCTGSIFFFIFSSLLEATVYFVK